MHDDVSSVSGGRKGRESHLHPKIPQPMNYSFTISSEAAVSDGSILMKHFYYVALD